MSTNDFDKLFKEKFEKQEFAFNAANWEKLTHALPKERSKRRLLPWLTGVAASVALVVGASWLLQKKDVKDRDAVVVSKPATQPSTNPVINKTAPDEKRDEHENTLRQIVPVTNNTLVTNKKESHLTTTPNRSVPGHQQENSNSPITTEPYDKNLSPFSTNPFTKPHEEVVTNDDPLPTPTKSITNENYKDPIFFIPDLDTKEKERRTSVSVAGGFNYGSFNTGYGASVNARQKIGRNLFVESDFGFMQNQEMIASAMSTEQFDLMNSGQFRGRPAKLEEKPYNIFYIQMAPSIGYQIHKNISVGLGADVQKLLEGKNEERPVITTEEGFKLIPLWDAGITGKTEYRISKRLKAGVLYREGINNFLQGSGDYYERRYLQIQMKLRLFGK